MGDLIASAELVKKIGRIAQLGERCPYKAEVTGSIPVPPTRGILVCGVDRSKEDTAIQRSGLDRPQYLVLSFRSSAIRRVSRGRRSAWLGRQIVNLEVAGSNPVGPAIFSRVWYTPSRMAAA